MGEHRGGGTAFTFEITDFVRFGSDNLLQVVVSNTFRSDVLPVSTDVNLYGGLYRDVELIVTDDIAISPLYYGSDGVLVRPSLVTPERIEAARQLGVIAKERGQSLAQMALAWVLNDERVTSVIIGTSSVAQLNNNLNTLDNLAFSKEELQTIDNIIGKPELSF